MDIRKELSKTLKVYKEASGFSYDRICADTGVSKSSLRYALNGGDVGLDVFQKLYSYFDIPAYICTDDSAYYE